MMRQVDVPARDRWSRLRPVVAGVDRGVACLPVRRIAVLKRAEETQTTELHRQRANDEQGCAAGNHKPPVLREHAFLCLPE